MKPLSALLITGSLIGVVAYRYLHTSAVTSATLTLHGNVDIREVDLAFKVPGRIEWLGADEEDHVKAGQVLARLQVNYFDDDIALAKAVRDDAAAQLQRLEAGSRPEEIDQADAQVVAIEATVARATQDHARAQKLIQQKAISQQEFDAYRATYHEAEASLLASKASRALVPGRDVDARSVAPGLCDACI